MAVEIRAADYAALRTALAAGTYQAGQMVFAEGAGNQGDYGRGHYQIVESNGHADDGYYVLTGGALAALRMTNAGDTRSVSIPAGVNWPAAWPLEISVSADRGAKYGSAGFDPKTLATYLACRSGAEIWVAVDGNDSTGDGSEATPYWSLNKAVQIGNATGSPYTVKFKSASPIYLKDQSIVSTDPTQDIAIVAAGDRTVRLGGGAALSWALDGSNVGVYTAARSAVGRVLDLNQTDWAGGYREYRYVPSIAECRLAPGTYHADGTNVTVHHFEKRAVTNSNTLVGVNQNMFVFEGDVNTFIVADPGCAGFELIAAGGTTSCGAITTTPDASPHIFYAENVTSIACGGGEDSYDAADSQLSSAFECQSMHGLAFYRNCKAISTARDAFNVHNENSAAYAAMLLENCVADRVGMFGSVSNNAVTAHEDAALIDVCGKYTRTRGGAIRNIGDSTCLLAGTQIGDDQGDLTSPTGVLPSALISVDDNAVIYANGCVADARGGRVVRAVNAGEVYITAGAEVRGLVTATGTATVQRDGVSVANSLI